MCTFADSFNTTKMMTDTECSDRYYYPSQVHIYEQEKNSGKKPILLHNELI